MLGRTVSRSARHATVRRRQTANSHSLQLLARAGLAARGAMYILIGWIALLIAFGHDGRLADNRGALRTVRSTAMGSAALWLLAIGFIGLALWRLAQALNGGPGAAGNDARARLFALFKAVLYGFLSYGTLRYAVGSGPPKSSNSQSVDLTATVLRYPGGQILVVIIGIALIVGGLLLIRTGWRKTFLRDLETGRMTSSQRRLARWIGEAGNIARGMVFTAAGVFLAIAGAEHRPRQAKGLDSTLRTFAHTPLGPWLLTLVALGLVLFGVYSCFEARWRRL